MSDYSAHPQGETAAPVAGWYPDPSGLPGYARYWNGREWQGKAFKATASGKPYDVLGIIALSLVGATIFLTFVFPFQIILGSAALIVSIVGVILAGNQRRPAILSIIALVISIGLILLGVLLLFLLGMALALSGV